MMNHSKFADELLADFLQRALGGDVEPVKVLRSDTYRVGNSHVLARVAADTGKYFFGLNYISAEEVANLDNSFVAFVCGDVACSVIMPMSELMKLLPQTQFYFSLRKLPETSGFASATSVSRQGFVEDVKAFAHVPSC